MRQGTSGFYKCVPNFTPTCFGKWLPNSGSSRCLISYSSNACVVGIYGLWSVQCGHCSIWNTPCIWRDFGSALPFQTRLTQTKPVLPLPQEHGSQVKDQGRRQRCHTKHKKFRYWPTRDVSLLSGHSNKICQKWQERGISKAFVQWWIRWHLFL
jgi:hypothetical protein